MKIMLTIILSFLLLMLIATVSLQAAGAGRAKIEVVDGYYDFGYVPLDFKLVHYFTIRNTGTSDLNIERAVSNCDCTSAIIMNKVLPPDSIGRIKVIFDTREYYGKNIRNITVTSNDVDNPTVELKYSSDINIIPKEFRAEPQSLFFLPGHQAKEVRLFNLGGAPLEFGIEMEMDTIFTIDTYQGTIMNGESKVIQVSPKDNLPRGTHNSNFTVSYNTDPATRVTVPVKIVRY
ncbi:MAG: DUF1573 domain-containing protein [Candidatus Zixiibacteriota bacterium]